MKNLIYTIGCVSLLFFNCTTDSVSDLFEPIPDAMDPEETVNYTDDIQSILTNNCTFCHNDPPVNGAPNALITYDQVVSAVNNSDLIERISKQAGENGAMPFGGPRLPQNLIDLVIQWEEDGLLEN